MRQALEAHRRAEGFTLIELMFALALAAILMGIALPNYGGFALRGRATAATAVLLDLRNRMEQRYADQRTYADVSNASRCAIANFSDADSSFSFSCTLGSSGQSFVWQATGVGATAGFSYSIDDAGQTQTLAVPSGFSARAMPANQFLTRKGS
jgi:type IV pilus assembly protein PilE